MLFHHGRNPEYRIDTSRKFNQQCSPLSKKTVIFSSIRVVDVVGVSTSPIIHQRGQSRTPLSQSIHRPPFCNRQPTNGKTKRKKVVVVVVCQCCTVFEKNYTTVRGKAQSQFACTHRPRYFFHRLPTAPSRTDTQEESEKRRVVFYQM